MGKLTGKVAIITGAGQGIGRASAVAFAREGAQVVVANRTSETGETTARLARASGGEALFVPTDVSQPDQVRRLVDTAVACFGGLDILFNNAGIGCDKPLVDLPEAEWEQVVAVNLTGHYLCCKYAIPHLRARGSGVIINMSSVLGFTALPGASAYCATKSAILGMTRALALELAPEGIRVHALAPGSVDTPMLWEGVPPDEMPVARHDVTAAQPVGYIGT